MESQVLKRFLSLKAELARRVLGQDFLVDRLLVALLADGHCLIEGAPGLAKTRLVKSLAELIATDFHRIQFTPDLLPADLIGSEIFRMQEGRFEFVPGPVFHQFLLADEINRAPAKVQSALLEAMAERQVTVGQVTYPMPSPFIVVATQNPHENEGVFALPESQRDRFLLHVVVSFPELEDELRIMALARKEAGEALHASLKPPDPLLGTEDVVAARAEVLALYMAPEVERYIVNLVRATRPSGSGQSSSYFRAGAGPRASISLDRAARAHAWLDGRDYVAPEDVQRLFPDVLRHRVALDWDATARGDTVDAVLKTVLEQVFAP